MVDTVGVPDFRRLFESGPGLYLVLRPAAGFPIVAVSDALLRATKTRRASVVGRGIFEAFPVNPEDPAATCVKSRAIESLERVVRERTTDAVEHQKYDIRRPPEEGGGFEERWWSAVSSPVLGADGELQHIITSAEDVTELMRLREARARAEERALEEAALARAVADASDAVSEAVAGLPETSLASIMRTIAAQAQALTGASYAAVGLGTDPSTSFDPWVQVGVEPEVAARIGAPPRPVGTLGVVALEGQEVRVPDVQQHPAFRGYPPGHPNVRSMLGVPVRFRGDAVGNLYLGDKRGAPEFTENDQRLVEMLAARAGAALETVRLYDSERAQRAWLRAVIDQLPEGVLLLDAAGRVAVRNRCFEALSIDGGGELDSHANAIALDLRQPSGERVPPEALPCLRAALHGESCSACEYVVHTRDDRLVPVHVSAVPILAATGEPSGAAMIVQDVSGQKELERLREEWASLVAHDLRQPVNTIVVAAGVLELESAPDEWRQRVLRTIRTSAQRISRMISDLGDASRIEAQRMTVDRRPTSLPELARDVIERMPELAPRCDVHVAPSAERPVWADAGRVEQILVNLLTNALKHGDPEARIELSLTPREDELEVTVTNRGAGIGASELGRVFERFERSRRAKATSAPGLGLGLYICKGLVDAHDGRIWVESVPGQTTSFHFTLPFVTAALEHAERKPA